MSDAEARDVVTGILADIAPEADLTEIDPAAELQPQLDIDSLDFLRFVEGIVERTGLPVPEQDYQQVATLDGAVAYVRARAGDARP
jgi:acyl carrier protein